jgi:hypothetical protein
MITGARQQLTSILLGVVAGLLVVNAYGLFFKPEPVAAPEPAALTPKQRIALADSKLAAMRAAQPDLEKTEKYQKLVSELDKLRAQEAARSQPQGEKAPERAPLSHEERQVQVAAAWNKVLAEHDSLPVNPTWAPQATQDFEADFEAMAADPQQHGAFVLNKVDCRSNSCKLQVEWPSYSEAIDTFGSLMSSELKNNCAVHSVLPEPRKADWGKPYQGYYVFKDCRPPHDSVAARDPSAR